MRVFSGNVKRKWQSGPPDLTWEIRRKPGLRPLAGLCGQQLIHGSRSLMTGDAPHCVILLDHTHRACSSPVLSIVAPSPFSLPTYTPGCSRMHTQVLEVGAQLKIACLPFTKPIIPAPHTPAMVMCASNPSTVEAGRLEVQGHPGQQNKFEANLSYTNPCLCL